MVNEECLLKLQSLQESIVFVRHLVYVLGAVTGASWVHLVQRLPWRSWVSVSLSVHNAMVSLPYTDVPTVLVMRFVVTCLRPSQDGQCLPVYNEITQNCT